MTLTFDIESYFKKQTKAAPLAVFRFLFGLLMSFSILRFWFKGWIEELYLYPKFHFHYWAFDFVQVPPAWATYLLFFICGLSALFVSIGLKYRLAIITFFLSFTFIELMDKTTYLNHYYFVSLLSFMLIFLPAHVFFSVDAFRQKVKQVELIPRWSIDVLKLMVAIVYIYAGLAKLNADWMINAMPLAIWLPSKCSFPFLGDLLYEKWLHYLFSWGGAAYDLFIVFLLLYKPTRKIAYACVIAFHMMTWFLFPIGMFPFIMMASTLIFFDASFHEKVIARLCSLSKASLSSLKNGLKYEQTAFDHFAKKVLFVFIIVQLVFPLRFLLFPGNVFWNEKGYRFAWRVMLMEKTAYANFKILDTINQKQFYVQNDDFLTALQEKQMSTQEDFIIEYGQFLGRHFESQGHRNLAVFVESHASLNGRKSQVYFDPDVDIMKLEDGLFQKSNILPLNE